MKLQNLLPSLSLYIYVCVCVCVCVFVCVDEYGLYMNNEISPVFPLKILSWIGCPQDGQQSLAE
jgi:hypothetical protein